MSTIQTGSKPTHKRDRLIEIEKLIQAKWDTYKTFESNP